MQGALNKQKHNSSFYRICNSNILEEKSNAFTRDKNETIKLCQ